MDGLAEQTTEQAPPLWRWQLQDAIPRLRALEKSAVYVVALTAATTGCCALLYFFWHGFNNIYGDGVYHLLGARRLVDGNYGSFAERYAQLGTPWLPLQPIALLPLIWNDFLWRTGLAGSIVSSLAFVVSSIVLFKLALLLFREEERPLLFASLTAFIFIFNFGMLYMQSTSMTEPLFMATFCSSVYFLQKWMLNHRRPTLVGSAVLMTLACLTRYEAWAALPFAGLIVLIHSSRRGLTRPYDAAIWGGLSISGPLYWLWHNYYMFHNPLEFYNGPYSAKAIYLRGGASAITSGSITISLLLVLVAGGLCAGWIVWLLSGTGLVSLCRTRRKLISWSPVLLLFEPMLFHVFSLYTGNIEMMVVLWWYNARYGLLYLPAAAICAPAAVLIARNRWRGAAWVTALIVFNYVAVYAGGIHQVSVFIEPYHNNVLDADWVARRQVSEHLRTHPGKGLTLLDDSLGSIVAASGLGLKDVKMSYASGETQLLSELDGNIERIVTRKENNLWKILHKPDNQTFELEYSTSGSPVVNVWNRTRRIR